MGKKMGKKAAGKKRQRSEAMHESTVSVKKKQRKDRAKAEIKETIETLARKQGEARVYLSKWRDDKSQWKFSKVMQTWLIKNAFDRKILPKSMFVDYFVPYVKTMSASAQSRLSETSTEIVDAVEKDGRTLSERVQALEKKAGGNAEVERKIKILRARYKRAKALLEVIAESKQE